nr:LOW QUALITY PROTEIN: NXPE family member 1-like [Pelodiscus sinensis]|eukprot:XP_014428330.1 LOW QUALITY PROTEIN: NXPE family member 1-like [Pelodiscus sinensis]
MSVKTNHECKERAMCEWNGKDPNKLQYKLYLSACEHIEEHNNLLISFDCFWRAELSLSLTPLFPCKGVSALQKAWKKGYEKIALVIMIAIGMDGSRARVMERIIQIQPEKYGHPFVSFSFFFIKDDDITRGIDSLTGMKDTAIMLCLHFRPFPIDVSSGGCSVFTKHIPRLLLRSPDTKVITRAENTRQMHISMHRKKVLPYGRFRSVCGLCIKKANSYVQSLAMKHGFQYLNIGVPDSY